LAPKYQPAAIPASRRAPCPPTATSDCTRESTPYAICVRSAAVGSHPLSGPPAVSRYGVNVAASTTAGARRSGRCSTLAARASAAGICAPQPCHIDRDSAHGRTAPYGQFLVDVPGDIAAMPSASRPSAVRASRPPPADTYAASPSTASALASAPSTTSHAGTRTPSTTCHSPYRDSTCRSSAATARSMRERRKSPNRVPRNAA
jgi:hypothetical protein